MSVPGGVGGDGVDVEVHGVQDGVEVGAEVKIGGEGCEREEVSGEEKVGAGVAMVDGGDVIVLATMAMTAGIRILDRESSDFYVELFGWVEGTKGRIRYPKGSAKPFSMNSSKILNSRQKM